MALSLMIRKQLFAKGCIFNTSEIFTKQALKPCTFATLQNLNPCRNDEITSSKSQVQVSQWQLQTKQHFSTTNRLLSGGGGNYASLWTAEKVVSVGLLGLLPGMFIIPSKTLEAVAALFVAMHMHWGLEAIFVDYVREKLFGPILPKICVAFCYVLSIFVFAGLLNIIYNETGLVNTIKMFWKL